MRKIELKSMEVKNFRGTKHRNIQFHNNTVISGRNGIGKTNILDAYCWTITGKLSDGKSAEDIRPITADSEDEIYVKVIVEIDGQEIEIEKINYLDIEKKTGKVKGNKTKFFINGIAKKSEKEYKAFWEDIASEEDILYSTTAIAFLNMDTKKRREKLFGCVEEISDEDVIKENSELEPVRSELAKGTADELLASYRGKLKGRSRSDKGLIGEMESIPVRIKEIESQIVDTDYTKKVAEIEETYTKKSEEKDEIDKMLEKVSDLNVSIMQMKLDLNTIESKAMEQANQERYKLERQLDDIRIKEQMPLDSKIASLTMKIKQNISTVSQYESFIAECKQEWKTENSKEFTSDTCPTCGQKLPKTKVEKAKERFEEEKKSRCNLIAEKCNRYIAGKKKLEEEIASDKESKSKLENLYSGLEENMSVIKSEIEKMRVSNISMNDNKEYQDLALKIQQAYKDVEEFDKPAMLERKRNIMLEQNDLIVKKRNIENMIALSDEAKKRIENLKEERKRIAQEIANVERLSDLVKDFQTAKCKMIEDKINSMFAYVNWKMFEPNVSNDGYKEICKPIIKGVKVESGLNHASRIIAEMDICKTFQKIAGIQMPIWIDDSESLDSNSVAIVGHGEHQVVMLKVTDGDFEAMEMQKNIAVHGRE